MTANGRLIRLVVAWGLAASLTAAIFAGEEPWKGKKISEWTDDDAKLVIANSPWAKQVIPEIGPPPSLGLRAGGLGGGGGGISRGGMGSGGMRRSGGAGYPGGGGSAGRGRSSQGASGIPIEAAPTLTLRWESALPIRAAAARARDTAAPPVDDAHYAIAVYGVPRYMAGEESKNLAADLRKHAALKREGRKDLKPSTVEIQQRESGPVFIYLFPRTTEITRADLVEFSAQIGRLRIAEPFAASEMTYEGKLEL